MFDKMEAMTEILTWVVPASRKIGSLTLPSDEDTEHSLRCSIYSKKTAPSEIQRVFEDRALIDVTTYLLRCYTISAKELEKDTEAVLDKYGQVRILGMRQIGDFGRFTEIVTESFS